MNKSRSVESIEFIMSDIDRRGQLKTDKINGGDQYLRGAPVMRLKIADSNRRNVRLPFDPTV